MKKLVTYTSYSKEEGRGSAVFANSNTIACCCCCWVMRFGIVSVQSPIHDELLVVCSYSEKEGKDSAVFC